MEYPGRTRRGITLVEILIAFAILAVLLSPIVDLVLQSGRSNQASSNEIVFTNLANELVDTLAHADGGFLRQCEQASQGEWKDLLTSATPEERRKYVQSAIPAQAREAAWSLERSGPEPDAGFLLRARIRWEDRGGDRELRLSRYVALPRE